MSPPFMSVALPMELPCPVLKYEPERFLTLTVFLVLKVVERVLLDMTAVEVLEVQPLP